MGYTTEFFGEIKIEPPLNKKEIDYVNKFSGTRRMTRLKGPYFVDGTGFAGQGEDADILDYNSPDSSQPGLWCKWVATPDGKSMEWNEQEKFYDGDKWMVYLVEHFLGDNPKAKQLEPKEFNFLEGHKLNGIIKAKGESKGDIWYLVVKDNQVKTFTDKAKAERELKAKVDDAVDETAVDIKQKQKKML